MSTSDTSTPRARRSAPAKNPFTRCLPALAPFLVMPLLFVSCAEKKANNDAASPAAYARIASMAPSCTTVLVGLGLGSSIVATDTWSAQGEGMTADLPRFDMMKPDAERLTALAPDLVLVSEMTKQGTSSDPFKPLSDTGIRVEYLPTSASVADIRADVERIAALVGRQAEAKRLIADMDREIDIIGKIGASIPESERRSVLFEISPAPYIYSFGSGVYLDELIALIGAKNALSGSKGWISVSGEAVVAANPDVILTNVNYGGDPVAEIMSRPGWEGVTAVREKRVFYVDNNASSQPSPNITIALRHMANAVYPEYYK